ncbi:MAG TPA: thiamine pyrophosphate-binding protein [Kofleriaceae bacterium]|jgi:acetolactate synthase-1/2/3 large subunit|nr:thiamine pyrophosphate-binding protein [Kofleriaceae bacterium]
MSARSDIDRYPTARSRPARVLVVDDDKNLLRAMERTVRSDREIELTMVDNAIDAMLAVGSIKPDLIVMDIFMPGLDGLEACRRIKTNEETRNTPVVLASVLLTPELEAAAYKAGAERVIAKPIDLTALRGATLVASDVSDVVEARAPEVTLLRGSDLLVRILAEAGVELVFGIPGGAISPVHDALLDSRIRVITTRHESGAMFAAAGYARATGKLGVVAVTSGPGVLNAMTGLASAWCDGVPMLLLVGEVPRPAHGKGVLQDGSAHGLQIVEMARHITKLSAEIPHGSALPHLVRRAIATALSGRRGPVMLTLPLDVTMAQIMPPRAGGSIAMSGVIPAEVLDEVAALLREVPRPLLLAGSGIRGDNAPEYLRMVAERIACPVATTPKGKGVFPETHPLALGVLGLGGHRSSRRYLESGLDVVIAIGTSLGDMATDGYSPFLQARRALVHVDIDARQIGKSYSPTHAIVAPAAEFLAGLAQRLGDDTTRRLRALPGGVERHALASSSRPDRIAAHDAVIELQRTLPEDTIYTVDSGEHFLFAAHFLETNLPDAFLVMTGLGSMGQSIGAAIGAQLAHPDRVVSAICGDGCFAMNAFEIATAVAEKLPIRVFVFNDERLGMVENGHQTVYGRHPEYPTAPLDVCTVAHGLGATVLRVDRKGQIAKASEILRVTRGPVVVDVRIDPEIAIPKVDRVAAMSPGSVPARSLRPTRAQ